MNQQTSPYRFITGHYLWLCIVVALGLALGTQAATAKECRRETPLPADVRLIAPGPEVPEAMARFAGAWIGAWKPQGILGARYQLGLLIVGRGAVSPCPGRGRTSNCIGRTDG